VDHFNFLDSRTYKQRYWVSNQYWDGKGPIFIYICGEYRCTVPSTRLYPFRGARSTTRSSSCLSTASTATRNPCLTGPSTACST